MKTIRHNKIANTKTNRRSSLSAILSVLLPIAIGIASCLLLLSCGKHSSPKFKQYYVHGEKLYLKHCSNCHQSDGSGLGRLYPPLNRSDFMQENFEKVICLIRHGTKGELIVNGVQFNQPMPGVTKLSDLEVAEIATYIYNTWAHDRGMVEVKDAGKILNTCDAHTGDTLR